MSTDKEKETLLRIRVLLESSISLKATYNGANTHFKMEEQNRSTPEKVRYIELWTYGTCSIGRDFWTFKGEIQLSSIPMIKIEFTHVLSEAAFFL